MSRIRLLCCLLVALLGPTVSLRGLAQEQEGEGDSLEEEFAFLEEGFLEEEVESASKHRQSIFWSPSAVSVYTREEIMASGAPTLVDFLRRVPGFDVYELKPSYPLIGARALTELSNDLVLLLIDGREELVELSGFALMNSLCIDYREIERIEVIRGPGSALYGANAFAAVINITTVPDHPKNRGEVYLAGGEDYHRLFARVTGSVPLWDGELSFGGGAGLAQKISPSDRYYEILQIPYRAHGVLRYRRGEDLDLSLHLGTVVGTGLFYTIMIGDLQLDDGSTYFVMGQARFSLGEDVKLKIQVYYNEYNCVFRPRIGFRAYDIWVANFPDFPMHTPTVDGQLQLDVQVLDRLKLIAGANLRYFFLHAENYDPQDLDDFRGAGFVQASLGVSDTFQLTGGLRLDLSSNIEPALSPRTALVYRPWPDHAFRLSYGLAFRKPSLYESGVHVPISDYNPAIPEVVEKSLEQIGNEDLTNEKVHSIEAGWQGIFLDERLKASVDLFFNIYRDAITWVVDVPLRMGLPDLANSTFTYINVEESIYALGGEAEMIFRPWKNWTLWLNLGMREAREKGRHRREEPRVKVNLGGRYDPREGGHADVAVHYVSGYEMPLNRPRNLLDNPVYFTLGNNLLLVARAGYRLSLGDDRSLDLGLTVRTPLGEPFREFPGEPIPDFIRSYKNSEFGGEYLVRLVAFYLRGSF